MKNSLKDMLNNNVASIEELFNSLTDYAMDKESQNGYKSLDEVERKLLVIGTYIMEVNNGGFDQYFLNTNGEYAKETIRFLKSIGEVNFLEVFSQAYDVYRSDMDEDEQYEAFEEIDIDFFNFDSEYNKLYEKCIQFVKEHIK